MSGRERMAVQTVESLSKLKGKQWGTASWLDVLSATFGSKFSLQFEKEMLIIKW